VWPESDTLFNLVVGFETSLPSGTLEFSPFAPCDFNNDGNCDIVDFEFLQDLIGACLGSDDYSFLADIDGSGCIDSLDQHYLFPDIEVSTSSYDFGSINVGNTSIAQSFIITNKSGGANLVVDTVNFTGPNTTDFIIQNDSCSGSRIIQLDTCSIDVVFKPTSGGAKNANLSIESNDPDDNIINVALSGIGIGNTTSSTSSTTTTAAITTTIPIPIPPCLMEKIYDDHSEKTELLRYIRDNVLTQTTAGQEIIRLYYEWSPAIVKAMEEDEQFKEEAKEMIDGILIMLEEK
jgi:hypothetical protein